MSVRWLLIETIKPEPWKQVLTDHDTEQEAWDQASEIDEEGLRTWEVVKYEVPPQITAHDRERFRRDDELQRGE